MCAPHCVRLNWTKTVNIQGQRQGLGTAAGLDDPLLQIVLLLPSDGQTKATGRRSATTDPLVVDIVNQEAIQYFTFVLQDEDYQRYIIIIIKMS